jgi:hypothetical protein
MDGGETAIPPTHRPGLIQLFVFEHLKTAKLFSKTWSKVKSR